MQQDVLYDMYYKVLKKSKLFSKILSEPCIRKLCLIVQEKPYMPDEIIFKIDEKANYLIFILDGTVTSFISAMDNKQRDQNVSLRKFDHKFALNEREFIL